MVVQAGQWQRFIRPCVSNRIVINKNPPATLAFASVAGGFFKVNDQPNRLVHIVVAAASRTLLGFAILLLLIRDHRIGG